MEEWINKVWRKFKKVVVIKAELVCGHQVLGEEEVMLSGGMMKWQ